MDIENFEFRPLTKGLGFDKTTEESQRDMTPLKPRPPVQKPVERKVEVSNSAPVSRSLKKMLDSLPPSMDFKEDVKREQRFEIPKKPEPKVEAKAPIEIPETAFPKFEQPVQEVRENFDITLDNSLSQAFPKAELNKTFYHQTVTPKEQFKEVTSSFASAMIDGLMVMALSALFIVSLVAITQIDLINMVQNHNMGMKVAIEITALFFGTSLVYYMLSRGMFGSTLGDWAFDVQLGSEQERLHLMYPFQVIFRTFIIIA
ncbi:MAG: hypothetical protein MJK18_06405, partial [Bdellovibrionales bacterium]|nr:hypothetical protein [Bdellovibrionales bacterium]